MRLVLDTDVVVAAMRSPSGASSALLGLAMDEKLTLLANVALVLEYEAVCGRVDHLQAANFSDGDFRLFIDTLASLAVPVESHFIWRPQLRDPADEMVLEAAVNGGADVIVSFNQRDFGPAPQRFGIQLMLPRDALRRLQE